MIVTHMLAILLAYILDLIIGDPKTWPHPVKTFGKLIAFLDRKLNRKRKREGVWLVFLVVLFVFLVSFGVTILAYSIHYYLGLGIETILIATTISQKGLKEAAWAVYLPLKNGEMSKAREKVSYIVGRDTADLDGSEIARATVETVAENTSDGITAPLFWAFIGGAPFALVYRAINTCDSMVGYKNEKYAAFGWASARLDDLVNWLPARLTGFLMLCVKPSESFKKRDLFFSLFKEAKHHESPNSGWTEAAVALLLGIQLGGTNYYKGIKSASPLIGQATRPIEAADILSTITIMHRVVCLFLILGVIGVAIYAMA